jgi:hypothetical protein
MSIQDTDAEIYDHVTADSLEVGDQTIIEGDMVVILSIDTDRDDIDEVLVKVENLSGTEDEFPLYADDLYPLWAL